MIKNEKKNMLRLKFKKIRNNINDNDKKIFNSLIHKKLFSSKIYKKCKKILTYISKYTEVDTLKIIEDAFQQKKLVFAPKCDTMGNMDFYNVENFNELEVSTFGFLEPKITKTKFQNSKNSDEDLAIVPGLAFDCLGYRLGYGGGFYDKFLKKTKVTSVGLCYSKCFYKSLPYESHDTTVNFVITENFVIKT